MSTQPQLEHWLVGGPPAKDARQGLFDVLKQIIDNEWGPFPDRDYWEMVDVAMFRMGLRQETQRTWDGGDPYSERFWRDAGERVFDERFDT